MKRLKECIKLNSMKKLLIIADYNDGDYVKDVVRVEDDVFEKFLPLMKAINNFEPYVRRSSFGGICAHNWISPREDLGEKNIYETYPQFTPEYIDEFIDIFTSGLYPPYDDCACHTIIEISDVVADEMCVNWNQDWQNIQKRYPEKVWGYINERNKITDYKRPSDGKELCSIPFNEMTEYENKLIEKLDNLWKDYQ